MVAIFFLTYKVSSGEQRSGMSVYPLVNQGRRDEKRERKSMQTQAGAGDPPSHPTFPASQMARLQRGSEQGSPTPDLH